jgi:hypothetical protein
MEAVEHDLISECLARFQPVDQIRRGFEWGELVKVGNHKDAESPDAERFTEFDLLPDCAERCRMNVMNADDQSLHQSETKLS